MAIVEGKAKVTLDGAQAGQQLIELEKRTLELRRALVDLKSEKVMDPKKIKDTEAELKLVNKEMQLIKIATKDYASTLKNLSGASLRELEAAAKKLTYETRNLKRGTDEYKKSASDLSSVKAEISKVRSEMYSAGVQTKTFGSRLKEIGSNLFAATGIIGGFTALIGVVKNAFEKIKEFGKKVSELEAITGASGADLDKLKNKAKDLAAQYGTSASEIVEAMKLVGSAKPELLKNVDALADVTDAVLTLSKASGLDLATSTSSLTTIMNQFGHGAEKVNEDINILAAGSKFGSVEVNYLAESISKVGTIASSAGLSLEQTTAMMELFGEKGIKAETAGTGFKSVLVELQKDTKNYTNGVFDLNKAIDNNQGIAGDNLALQKKFGKEFFGLAQILLQNKERFNELNQQVTGTNTAFEQAAIAMDNLSGDLDKAAGAWDKFVLSVEDGDGVISKSIRSVIQNFTTFLGNLSTLNDESATSTERMTSLKDILSKTNPFLTFFNEKMGKIVNWFIELNPGISEAILRIRKLFGLADGPGAPVVTIIDSEAETKATKEVEDLEKELTEDQKKELEKRKENARKAYNEMLDANIALSEQIKQNAVDLMADGQQRDEAAIQLWYDNEQRKIESSKASAEFKNAALEALEEIHQQKLREIQDKYLELDLEAQQLLIDSEAQRNADELAEKEEQEKKLDDIEDKDRKDELDKEKKLKEEKLKLIQKNLKTAQMISGAYYDFITTAMDNELAAAGDNEEYKKEILKKYADKQFIGKAAQIVASTAQAVMAALAELGPIAGPIAAGIMSATGLAQLALANTERQKMKGLASGGKFGVTRAQDGRNFNAEYGGNGTGYYSKPTVLVAEEGPEFVVSNKALRVPEIKRAIDAIDSYQRTGISKQLNYSGLMQKIPVKGFAEGGFVSTDSLSQQSNTNRDDVLVNEIRLLFDEIKTWQREIKTYVVADDISDKINELNALKTEVTL